MSDLLQRWARCRSYLAVRERAVNQPRRDFLRTSVQATLVLACAPAFFQLSACQRDDVQRELLSSAPWPSFAAVYEVLFPADGNGPGAGEIHATLYLSMAIQAPDNEKADREFVLDGIKWLDDYAKEQHAQRFIELSAEQRDSVLRAIAQSRAGDRWLSQLMGYLIEALLADPVYGGNPEGIGWRWLEHSPGFPRPNAPYYRPT